MSRCQQLGDQASRASYWVDRLSKPSYWSDLHCAYAYIYHWQIFILISQTVGQDAAVGAVCVSAGYFCLFRWLGMYVYMCCIHVFVHVPTRNTLSFATSWTWAHGAVTVSPL